MKKLNYDTKYCTFGRLGFVKKFPIIVNISKSANLRVASDILIFHLSNNNSLVVIRVVYVSFVSALPGDF